MSQLAAIRRRWAIPSAAWVLGVAIASFGVWWRTPPSVTVKATRELQINERLVLSDLQPADVSPFVDHYARHKIEAGASLEPSMVSKDPILSGISSLAVIVPIPAMAVKLRHLKVGSAVSFYDGALKLEPPGKIVQLSCEIDLCPAVITLAMPKDARDADFVKAEALRDRLGTKDALQSLSVEPVLGRP